MPSSTTQPAVDKEGRAGRPRSGAGVASHPPSTYQSSMAVPLTDSDLFARLDALGIAHKTQSHAPVFTVEEAKALRGEIVGGHTKNLFLKDKKDGLWLVVAREHLAIDLTALVQAARRAALFVRLGRVAGRGAGRAARLGDAVFRHQRRAHVACRWCSTKACWRSIR
jgi:hypothetical protein